MRRPDGSLACTTQEKLIAMAKYREKLFSPKENSPEQQEGKFRYNDAFREEVREWFAQTDTASSEGPLDYEFTTGELESALAALKNHKAASKTDGIVNELLKYSGEQLKEILRTFFNWIREAEMIDPLWAKSLVVNLFKGGDAADPGNYRGISLMSCLGKLYLSLWAARVTAYVDKEQRIRPEQGGFMPGRMTVDLVYALMDKLRRRKKRAIDSYLLFVDFKKAFDTVWRKGLFKRLWDLGIKGKAWRIFRSLYAQTTSRVLVDGQTTREMEDEMGVQQGSPLSPVLFNIFIDELARRMAEALGITDLEGVNEIRQLLYADDIVFIADSAEQLQTMANVLAKFCEDYRLEINLKKNKSEVMVVYYSPQRKKKMREKARQQRNSEEGKEAADEGSVVTPVIYFRDQVFCVTESYRYLGVLIEDNLRWNAQAVRAARLTAIANWEQRQIWKAGLLSPSTRLVAWKQLVRAKLEYAQAVWYPENQNKMRSLEAKQAGPIKAILGIGARTKGILACALGRTPTLKIRFQAARVKYYARLLHLRKEWSQGRVLPAGVVFHDYFNEGDTTLVGLELWAKIPEAIINGDGDLTVAISDFLTKPVPKPGEHPQETLPGHKARAKVRFDAAVDKWAYQQMRDQLKDHWEAKRNEPEGKNLYNYEVIIEGMQGRADFPRWHCLGEGKANLVRRRILSGQSTLRAQRSRHAGSEVEAECSCKDGSENTRHFLLQCSLHEDRRAEFAVRLRIVDAKLAGEYDAADRATKMGMLLGCSSKKGTPPRRVDQLFQNHLFEMWCQRPEAQQGWEKRDGPLRVFDGQRSIQDFFAREQDPPSPPHHRREEPEEVEEIVDDHPSPSSMPHILDRDDELEDSVEGGIDRCQIFASALEAHVPGLEFR
jgi:hypothetical protein